MVPAVDQFSAPTAGCPGQAALNERVAKLAGSSAAPRHARVAISATPSGYHTRVELVSEGEARERAFDTETCEAGIEAAAIVIALGSGPESASTAPRGSPAPEAPPELAAPRSAATPAAPATPAATPAKPATRPAPVIHPVPVAPPGTPAAPATRDSAWSAAVRLSAEVGFDAFALPSVAPTAALGVSVAVRDRYWVELRALGALPQEVAATGGRARFTLFGAALRGCYLAQAASVAGGPCLGVSVVRIGGEGKGLAQPLSGAQLYGGPSAGALARWSLTPRLALRATLEGLIALGSQPFNVNSVRVYAPESVDLSGAFGADFRF